MSCELQELVPGRLNRQIVGAFESNNGGCIGSRSACLQNIIGQLDKKHRRTHIRAEGAKQRGVAAQQFIKTTLFSMSRIFRWAESAGNSSELGVIEELADCWNVRLESAQLHRAPHTGAFVLNFHKGIPVQRDSGIGTLGEFYDSFALPSKMKLAGLYLYLEALILIPEFEETTGCKVPDFILSTKDKNKRTKELE
ncbi:hypothetical protein B0H14DRAFT_2605199 [Mycena olivaceomarginata]|nr:hypothetical protein B0H14DRAFT_2605199 [Mycena olivaceomarginata]